MSAPAATPSKWELPGAGFQWAPGSVESITPAVSNDSLPGRFQTFAAPKVRPGRTFARSAVEAGLDAAALPVVAASKLADRFTGRNSTFSNLSGRDAAESLEWLYDRSEPNQIRREEQFAEGEIPQAQAAGKFTGEYIGGAPLAALTARAPSVGGVLHMSKKERETRAKQAGDFARSHPDAEVLRDYMRSGYERLNRELRTGNVSKDTAVQADRLSSLLDEMHASGHRDAGVVYRGVELPNGVLDQWRRAGAVQNKSFWSTSRNGDVAETFSTMNPRDKSHDKAILRITQKSGGVPVGGYEGEVLQRPGKTWVIKRETTHRDGTPVLDLREVDAPPPGITPVFSFGGRSSPGRGVELPQQTFGQPPRPGQDQDDD